MGGVWQWVAREGILQLAIIIGWGSHHHDDDDGGGNDDNVIPNVIITSIIIIIKLARLKGYSPPSRGLTGNCKFAIPTILCGGKIDH